MSIRTHILVDSVSCRISWVNRKVFADVEVLVAVSLLLTCLPSWLQGTQDNDYTADDSENLSF